MARKPLDDKTQTAVLTKSRRRCCICFGLNRDTGLKSGQIAHLDQDSSNNKEGNLAFLCFDHHDEYDSTTRQRKGLTESEVKAYRSELYQVLGRALEMPVHFGAISLPASDPYAGTYIRLGTEDDSAEIKLTPLTDSLEGTPRYAVTGFALWGTQREYGPNIGDFAIVADIDDGVLEHFEPEQRGEPYSLRIEFDGNTALVKEEGYFGRYGLGVHFMGRYRRAE